jgi:lysozyme family protein
MADFGQALVKVLENEGGFFHNQETGEVVNRGVTLDTLRGLGFLRSTGPATPADVAFVQALSMGQTASIYRLQYWDKLELDKITSQDVAAKIFDLSVNVGTVQATKFVQRAVGVRDDGVLGPVSLAAINKANPAALLSLIRWEASKFYRDVAAAHPDLAPNLAGWLARLEKA